MRGKLYRLTMLLVLLVLTGCQAQLIVPIAEPTVGNIAISDRPRQASPDASLDDLRDLTADNDAFALDLYQALRGRDGNLFYSPYSISLALAMTYAGARSETAAQMADAMHFHLPPERLHAAFNKLERAVKAPAPEAEPGSWELRVANALWGQSGYAFMPDFLDLLAENYGAGLRLLDFAAQPGQAREEINDWVSRQTAGKIEELLPEDVISQMTRLVLTNAIYFNGDWAHPFDPNATDDAPFYLLDGEEVAVPTMRQTAGFPYAQGEGYQAVELPYAGGKTAMHILLPDEGMFEELERTLDAERLADMLGSLEETSVELSLPIFSFESELGLAETLADMGMPDAFDPGQADFSGMDGTRNLFIEDVIHKAFVAVDEEGTEAAAATGVAMGLTSMPMDVVQMTVDRPFLFLIRDLDSGTILFIGRVMNPGK